MDETGQDPAPAASPKTAGWVLLVIGVLVMLLAADVIPQDSMPPNVPSPVLFVVLPDWLNVYLGRIAFGAFAIVFFGIGVAAWLSAARLRQDSGS